MQGVCARARGRVGTDVEINTTMKVGVRVEVGGWGGARGQKRRLLVVAIFSVLSVSYSEGHPDRHVEGGVGVVGMVGVMGVMGDDIGREQFSEEGRLRLTGRPGRR